MGSNFHADRYEALYKLVRLDAVSEAKWRQHKSGQRSEK